MGSNSQKRTLIVFFAVIVIAALVFAKVGQSRRPVNIGTGHVAKLARNPADSAPGPSEDKTELPAIERQAVGVLHDIIQSKNDNDPRLDSMFQHMTPQMHQVLENEYQKFPLEKRNERGLIAFLIARDLQDEKDLHFLRSLYTEKPCLSMIDCGKTSGADSHHAGMEQTSANYPQLAALYQIEKQLETGNPSLQDQAFKSELRHVLEAAAQFPVPMVYNRAESILQNHSF